MTEIDVISGFLGCGKTTFIKKLIDTVYNNQRIVVIENDFGEENLDGIYLRSSNICVSEISSGCICCSLAANLSEAVGEVLSKFSPERIIVEPSGVARLSDVLKTVHAACERYPVSLGAVITISGAEKTSAYMRRFGGIFKNQIQNANVVLVSSSDEADPTSLKKRMSALREMAPNVPMANYTFEHADMAHLMNAARIAPRLLESNPHTLIPVKHHNCEPDTMIIRTKRSFTKDELMVILKEISENPKVYGEILRAKGFVASDDGGMLKADIAVGGVYVEECDCSTEPCVIVIGLSINKGAITNCF